MLRIIMLLLVPILLSACATGGLKDLGPNQQILFRPGDLNWQDGPASLERGAQFVVLEGNPAEEGVFTMRIRMPDGFRIAPHTHPRVERVTVLSGAFHLGMARVFDRNVARRLEPGSYTSMPPGMVHFAFVEGETEIQLTTVGPWEIHYVNPQDDPRTRTN